MTLAALEGPRRVPPWAQVLVGIVVVLVVLGAGYLTAIDRPDLLRPTLSGDASNYEAAGERLNAGHNLYGPLLAGDRPIPGYPLDYPAPLLSPPLVAVVWRPLALFGDASIQLWWLLALALTIAIVVWFALVGRLLTLGALLGLVALGGLFAIWTIRHPDLGAQAPISFAAFSGNLNAYVLGLCVLVWWASNRDHPHLAGVVVGLAAVLKLGPFALAWWLLVRRDWPALKAFVATVAILGLVGLVGAGLDANLAFARLALGSNVKPTGLSVPGMLEAWVHVNPLHAGLGTIVATVGGLAVVYLTRRRARISFFVTMLIIVYSSPVVLAGNLVVLLAAATPVDRSDRSPKTVGLSPGQVHPPAVAPAGGPGTMSMSRARRRP